MKKTVLALALLAVAVAAAPAQEGDDAAGSRRQEILNKLGMKVTVDFNRIGLEEALNFVRDFSGLNIVVDAEVSQKLTEDQLQVTLKVKDLTLKSVLKLMLGPKDLTAVLREGVIMVLPKGKTDHAVTLQVYDVRGLMMKIQDFPGPVMELVTPNRGGAGMPLSGIVVTMDDPRPVLEPDFVKEMIKTNTGDRTWEENPNASVELANGILIVSQSRRVHREIREFLSKLQQFR